VTRITCLLLLGMMWLSTGQRAVAEEGNFLRDRALALFEERCAPFKDPTYPEQAPRDYEQLLQWGYTPDEILMYAEEIPETCLQISFLDAIATVIRTTDDPLAVTGLGEPELVVAEGLRPLEGPEVLLPVLGVSFVLGGTFSAWSGQAEGYSGVVFGLLATGIALCVVSVGMLWTPDRPGPGRPPSRALAFREIRWTVGPGSLLVRF